MEHQDYTSIAQGAAEKVTSHAQEIALAVTAATPPVAVTGMHLAGYPLADWLVLATLVYTVLQVIVLLHRLWRERQEHIQYKLEKDNDTTRGKP